jgi:DNA-binding response OmpR family regulator
MNPVSGDCPLTAAVALVGFEDQEIACLESIVERSGNHFPANCVWEVHRAPSVDAVVQSLASEPVSIVMCDGDRAQPGWRNLLERLRALPRPPLQIVTSRAANDRLWAEALNLGAYDVLARPFEPAEVLRTLSMAWRRWHDTSPR